MLWAPFWVVNIPGPHPRESCARAWCAAERCPQLHPRASRLVPAPMALAAASHGGTHLGKQEHPAEKADALPHPVAQHEARVQHRDLGLGAPHQREVACKWGRAMHGMHRGGRRVSWEAKPQVQRTAAAAAAGQLLKPRAMKGSLCAVSTAQHQFPCIAPVTPSRMPIMMSALRGSGV